MKNIHRKILKYAFSIALAVALFAQHGCTDDFTNINKNPHEFTKVEAENLMATAVKRTMNSIATMNAKMFWPYSHQVAMHSGSTARYGSSTSDVNNIWKNFYTTIFLLRNIRDNYNEDETYHNRVLIAEIWECYLFYIGATTFGGMPYTDACRTDITIIPYDTEQYIYNDILRRLSEAFDKLDPEKDSFARDPVFADNEIVMWKKFANSLRLKIALEVQNAVPENAEKYGKEALSNEDYFISSNDENIILKWGGSTMDESSDYYLDYVYTMPESSSKPAYSHMMFVYQRSYKDPRMEKYADEPEAAFTIRDTVYWDETFTTRAVVRYTIPYNGRPVSPANNYAGLDESSSQVSQANPLRMLSSTQYSMVNSSFLREDGEIILIWFADMCFMQAEAALNGWGGTKTPEDYYNDGIDASFAQYGLSQAQAEKYRSQDGVKWGSRKNRCFSRLSAYGKQQYQFRSAPSNHSTTLDCGIFPRRT